MAALVLSCICGKAQPYWENYELLTTRQGLPHNMVLSLMQDSEGYLWIGTYNGLCRYDGHTFETYKNVFGPSHSNNWFHAIEVLYEDRDGNVWIGSRGGLISRFDKRTGKFYPYRQVVDGNKVQSIYQDSRGHIWVGHINGTVGRVNGDTITYISQIKSGLLALGEDNHASIVVIGDYKMHYYDSAKGWLPYKVNGLLEGTGIYWAEKRGRYWAIHTVAGWVVADVIQQKVKAILLPVFTSRIMYRKMTFSGNGYITAENFRLRMYDSNGRATDSIDISPNAWNNNHEMHNCLLSDNKGIVWMGTNTGLYKVDPRRYMFKKYARNNPSYPLGDNYVRTVYATGNELWTGTKDGCVNQLIYDEVRKQYVLKAKLPLHIQGRPLERHQYTINALLKYGDDMLAGGEGVEVIVRRKNSKYFVPYDEIGKKFEGSGIWKLYADEKGNIWVGTLNAGLYIWDCKTREIYNYSVQANGARKLHAKSVWNIYRDKNKILWLGTDSGLFRVNNAGDIKALQLQYYPLKVKDNQQVNVWNMAEDRYGNMWLGTTGHGLFQLTAGRDKYISYADQPNRVICGIVADSADNLWISTVNGLYRYNIAGMYFTRYDEEDGLLSNEFNFKAATATPDGLLAFGNKTGMLCFSPADIAQRTAHNVSVRLSALSIAGKDTTAVLYAGKPVILPYNQNFIDFGFSILDFSKPLSNRYRYRLLGLDEEWREANHARPSATYTNLPPGDYRFVVYGSIDGANWSKTPASFSFIIKPAFWQTWAFIAAVITLILLLTAWLVYRRIQTVVKREREKHRIEKQIASLELQALQAQMNPHFIFNAINSIQHFVLHNDVLTANDYLSRFARLMRLFLESSKNRYITLQRELELLHLYLQLEQLRFEDKFIYNIVVGTGIDIHKVNIPPALIQPFVENAINHGLVQLAGCGRLQISFIADGADKIKCIVDDNGIGREKSARIKAIQRKEHVSRGMQLIEERIKTYNFIDEQDIHIHITDKTPPEQGTRVEITLPATLPEFK